MTGDLRASVRPALTALAIFSLLTGIAYPALVLGIAQVIASSPTDPIGTSATDATHFWGRPGSYDAMSSGASNLGPSNPALREAVQARIAALRSLDPDNPLPIPVDLVTTSGSGLDPHISPEAAYYQAARVARTRGLPADQVRTLIATHIEGRTLGLFGEPRVNVISLNRALDRH